jgi:predicted transglutaminase-like cysteine proteinase
MPSSTVVPEVWTLPTTYGDCEDYVLMKRQMLIDNGWPASALLITVVRERSGEGHAVLTVRTDRGDFILDNQEANVLRWDETNYHYIKRQSEFDETVWASINDGRV